MSFFDEAKHKIEEVVGKVERTVGGAFGNTAMEFSGEAHAEHGEALLEEDEERHMYKPEEEQPGTPPADGQDVSNPAQPAATGEGAEGVGAGAIGEGGQPQDDEAAKIARRENEQELVAARRKIEEAKDAAAKAHQTEPGESMRGGEPEPPDQQPA